MAGPEDVNGFREEVARRIGPFDRASRINRLMGQSVPGQEDIGIPDYDNYTQRRNAQQKYMDQFRRLFGLEPQTAPRGSVPPVAPQATPEFMPPGASTPPGRVSAPSAERPAFAPPGAAEPPPKANPWDRGSAPRPAGARAAGAAGPAGAAIGLAMLADYLQRGSNPMGLTVLPQLPGFSYRNPPPPRLTAGPMAETPAEISPIPEERGRDTGQIDGPARPQARTARPKQAAPAVDPRFTQLLARVLEAPQAPQQASPPQAPAATAPRRLAPYEEGGGGPS